MGENVAPIGSHLKFEPSAPYALSMAVRSRHNARLSPASIPSTETAYNLDSVIEFQHLQQTVTSGTRLDGCIDEDVIKVNTDAFNQYNNFLTGEGSLTGKLFAVAPVFKDYMLKTAAESNLGMFFNRLLTELETADTETVKFLSQPGVLGIFSYLDRVNKNNQEESTRGKLERRGNYKRQKNFRDSITDYPLDDLFQLMGRDFYPHIDTILNTVFDKNDQSDRRKLYTTKFPYIVGRNIEASDFEMYCSIDDLPRLEELALSVPEDKWQTVIDYVYFSYNHLYKKAQPRIDAEIKAGDTSGAQAILEFAKSTRRTYAERSFGQDDPVIRYWIDQYHAGDLSNEELTVVASGWRKRREAVMSLPEDARSKFVENQTPFLDKKYIYEFQDEVAFLTRLGLQPTLPLVNKVSGDPELVNGLSVFCKDLLTSIPTASTLDLLDFWSGKPHADLEQVAENIKILSAVRERLPDFLKDSIFAKCLDMSLSEVKLDGALPEFVDQLVDEGIIPTPILLDHVLHAPVGEETLEYFRSLRKLTEEGKFDPKNLIQRDLEYARYIEMTIPARTIEQYRDFTGLEFTNPNDTEALDPKTKKECFAAAIEAARVYYLIKESVDAGNKVLVVANERYGKLFVADPLGEDLRQLGVEMFSTYVRSNPSNRDKKQEIFSQEQWAFIQKEKPEIFIVDGTPTPLLKETPRFSRAMNTFHDLFKPDSGYNIRFWSTNSGKEALLGDDTLVENRAEVTQPSVTIVNSTINAQHIDGFSSLESHVPGYFDDHEMRMGARREHIIFGPNGLTRKQFGFPSQERFLSAVQREIKTRLPEAFMHADSDPNK